MRENTTCVVADPMSKPTDTRWNSSSPSVTTPVRWCSVMYAWTLVFVLTDTHHSRSSRPLSAILLSLYAAQHVTERLDGKANMSFDKIPYIGVTVSAIEQIEQVIRKGEF